MVIFPVWDKRGRWVANWRWRCEWEAQLEHRAVAKNLERGLASSPWFSSLPFLFYL